ncbi:MAG: glycosyltransferase [DPANN group archaeon]|nr:glycosyltransferase [DPANN group archaeon]
MDKTPFVSFIICTYSTKQHEMHNLIKRCLKSVFAISYPKDKFEVICVDGGSSAETIKMIASFPVTLIQNKKRFPEGRGMGKSQGLALARGDFIAFVDHDNMLIGENWLYEMLKPMLADQTIFGCDCRLLARKEDKITNRYLSYVGTDPFAAEISLHGLLGLKKVKLEDCGDYHTTEITPEKFFIAGGNCFIYRKSALDAVGGYTKDVDVIFRLAKLGLARLAIPKNAATHHYAVYSFWNFIKKKTLWAKVHVTKNEMRGDFSWTPKNRKEFLQIGLKLIKNFLILPNTIIGLQKAIETKDSAWLLHPVAMFATTAIYASVGLLAVLGFKS